MDNEVNYWELSQAQWELLEQYCTDSNFLAKFTPYGDCYYLQQTSDNLRDYESLFLEFDMDDGTLGNSFGTRTWTKSTVPSALWP